MIPIINKNKQRQAKAKKAANQTQKNAPQKSMQHTKNVTIEELENRLNEEQNKNTLLRDKLNEEKSKNILLQKKLNGMNEPVRDVKLEPKVEPVKEVKAEPKIEPVKEPIKEVRVEPKVEPKVETKAEPKAEPEPQFGYNRRNRRFNNN